MHNWGGGVVRRLRNYVFATTSEFMKDVFRLTFVFTGGLLLEAAEALQDESILANIPGQDLVAIEVRYHRLCYKDYTGFLVHQKGNKASGNQSYTSYKKVLEVFGCTVVDTCIIDKLKIMRMVSLQELFIKTVREVENLDDSVEIRGFYLKQKLKARYPLLQFLIIIIIIIFI